MAPRGSGLASARKTQNAPGATRGISKPMPKKARQKAHERARAPALSGARNANREEEALFAELKNQIGLRRVRLRRMKHVREQFFLAATAQNLKRLARFLRSESISHGPDLR